MDRHIRNSLCKYVYILYVSISKLDLGDARIEISDYGMDK